MRSSSVGRGKGRGGGETLGGGRGRGRGRRDLYKSRLDTEARARKSEKQKANSSKNSERLPVCRGKFTCVSFSRPDGSWGLSSYLLLLDASNFVPSSSFSGRWRRLWLLLACFSCACLRARVLVALLWYGYVSLCLCCRRRRLPPPSPVLLFLFLSVPGTFSKMTKTCSYHAKSDAALVPLSSKWLLPARSYSLIIRRSRSLLSSCRFAPINGTVNSLAGQRAKIISVCE
jgi:hypothetical protein